MALGRQNSSRKDRLSMDRSDGACLREDHDSSGGGLKNVMVV